MHRTEILLEKWRYEALKARAGREGRSLSDVVRAILSEHLKESATWASQRLADIAGVGEGPSNLGEEHDRYLYGPARTPRP